MNIVNEERLKELEEVKDLPEYEKRKRIKSLTAKLSRWSPKHRRIGLQAVVDDRGVPLHEENEASKCISDYWGQVMSRKDVNVEEAMKFLKYMWSNAMRGNSKTNLID